MKINVVLIFNDKYMQRMEYINIRKNTSKEKWYMIILIAIQYKHGLQT